MAKRAPVAGTAFDPTIEFAELEIDGQSYKLAYDFGSIAKAEGAINAFRAPGEDRVNLLQGLAAALVSGMDARQTLGLFWAALSIADPEITLPTAAKLIRVDTLPSIMAAITRAYNLSMPEAKTLKADPTTAAKESGVSASSPGPSSGANTVPTAESISV